jgi:benzoylformate decarboxylase
MDALVTRPNLTYILALQEATAVAMADGYALATGRPAFVNLHAAPGLGNGIGNLYNAQANGSPLVVTAGQQDTRHLHHDPLLAGDLTALARPVTKWAHEVFSADALAVVLRRAFRDVQVPPTGPVFVSIPSDVLDMPAGGDTPARSKVLRASVPSDIAEIVATLSAFAPGQLAIVAGDENAQLGGVGDLVRVAELLDAPVYGAPLYGTAVFPTTHPLWAGALPSNGQAVRAVLDKYHGVFLVSRDAFKAYPWSEGSPVPEGTALIHLSASESDIGRTWTTSLGVAADPPATLRAIAERLDTSAGTPQDATVPAAAEPTEGGIDSPLEATGQPLPPTVAMQSLLAALPNDVPLVNEAITTGLAVRDLHRISCPRRYYFARGGGLGWGMPAAVGVSLGLGREPVVAVVGDGSAMYSPQSLWSAAKEQLPVLFVVVNNQQYLILKQALRGRGGPSSDQRRFLGMELSAPRIDFVSLAQSMGVPARRADDPDAIAQAAREATKSGEPFLLEIPIAAPV